MQPCDGPARRTGTRPRSKTTYTLPSLEVESRPTPSNRMRRSANPRQRQDIKGSARRHSGHSHLRWPNLVLACESGPPAHRECHSLPPRGSVLAGRASPSRTARTTWSWRNGLNSIVGVSRRAQGLHDRVGHVVPEPGRQRHRGPWAHRPQPPVTLVPAHVRRLHFLKDRVVRGVGGQGHAVGPGGGRLRGRAQPAEEQVSLAAQPFVRLHHQNAFARQGLRRTRLAVRGVGSASRPTRAMLSFTCRAATSIRRSRSAASGSLTPMRVSRTLAPARTSSSGSATSLFTASIDCSRGAELLGRSGGRACAAPAAGFLLRTAP